MLSFARIEYIEVHVIKWSMLPYISYNTQNVIE